MAGKRTLLRLVSAVVIVGIAAAVYILRPTADAEAVPGSTEVAVQGAALPRLLDLGADKCVPCKMMAPILEELKHDYAGEMIVDFVDVWKDPSAAQPYGIRVIPTQIFFSAEGAELYRHEGFYSREDILAKWRELGVALPDKGA